MALVASAFAAGAAPVVAQDRDALALAVKATYLYKFAPFVEWPAQAGVGDAFGICVVGDPIFHGVLDRAAGGQEVQERPVRVLHFSVVDDDSKRACRIMYIAGSSAQPVAEALAAVRGAPILTVTDDARSERDEGVIHFVVVRGKIKFRIDNRLAEESGLVINSQLLNLAISVRASGSDAGAPRVQ